LALQKPVQKRISQRVVPVLRVSDSRWYEKAKCFENQAPITDFEIDAKSNVLYKAMRHCTHCIVRRDCVIDAVQKKDTGVIRGGIQMRDKMKREVCRRCRLPVAAPGKLCTFCAILRTCLVCKSTFPAKYTWLAVDKCPQCIEAERLEAKRAKGRRLRKKKGSLVSKPRVSRLRRRK
jgi:hypothetical protein